MKIRIEGCTAERLAEYSDYLTLGKVYAAHKDDTGRTVLYKDDTGTALVVRVNPSSNVGFGCVHLPRGAKWVEVAE